MTNKQYDILLRFLKQNIVSVGITDLGTMYDIYDFHTDTEVAVLCTRNNEMPNKIVTNYVVLVDGTTIDACNIDLLTGPQTQAEKRILNFVKECSNRLIAQETAAQKSGFLRSLGGNQH